MVQMQKLVLVVCTILVLTIFGVSQASAAVTPRPAVKVDRALSLSTVSVVKCWASDWTISWLRKSSVGIKVWRYGLTITDYCWNGTQIVLINSRRFGKVFVPLWDFTGHIDQQLDWNGTWSFRRWTEGRFVWMGSPGIAVRTPEVWFKVRGDGYVSYEAVGD